MPNVDPRRGTSAVSLGRLGLLCLLAAAWLAWPRPRGVVDEAPRLVCVLIDASAPVRRRDPGYAGHLSRLVAREVAAAEAEQHELAVALYDRGARWWLPPGDPGAALARLSRGDAPLGPPEPSAACDLAAGLELAREALLAPGRPPGKLLVVGDGTSRGRDPEGSLGELVARGVALRFEALPVPALPDARIHALRLPADAEVGAPLGAALEWSLDYGAEDTARLRADGELRLYCEFRDASGAAVFERELAWPEEGAAIQRTQIELGPAREGAVWLRARVQLRGPDALRSGDPIPENDRAEATGRVGAARIALAVAPGKDLPALRAWLAGATPGVDWIVREPDALDPLPQDVDLICSFDLAPDQLPHALIESALARGGGWFHAGGWSWLERARGPEANRLARLSPLAAADPGGPPVERLFLVDGSGSMRGEPFAAVRRALEGMLPLVADADRIVLQLFSNALGPRVILAEAGVAAGDSSLARLRAVQVPGGSTEILDCLDIVARRRLDEPTERATVLLLSDGREDDALRVDERAQRIRDSFRATRRELSALAAGPSADEVFLSQLVGSDGRLVRAENFDALTELFRAEIGSERALEGDDARALPSNPVEPAEARALSIAFQSEVRFARAVRCKARPGVGVLWTAPDGSPLLALARAGGGSAAALATQPGAEWGAELTASDLAPLWRALARGASRDAQPTARVDGTQLVLTGCGAEIPAIVELELWRESGARRTFEAAARERLGSVEAVIPFAASGRDLSDRRRAVLPGELAAAVQSGGIVLRSIRPPLVIPVAGLVGTGYLPEARTPIPTPRDAVQLAADTEPGRGPHPATPWVLALGLAAVFGSALRTLLGRPSERS